METPKKEIILDDTFVEILPMSLVCHRCVHLLDGHSMIRKCKAFKQIPLDIWEGKNKHTIKHPKQDNDIVFTKLDYDPFEEK